MLCYRHRNRPDILEAMEIMNEITSGKDDSTDRLQSSQSIQHSSSSSFDINLRETEIETKNEEIRLKDRQIEQLQTKIESQTSEMVSKDEEISRLRSLLNLATKK